MPSAFPHTLGLCPLHSGAAVWGYLADEYGRKAVILGASTLVLLSALGSAATLDIAGMLAARGIMGLGIGGIPVAFSLFMEYIPSNTRGMWGVIIDGIWWALGSIVQAGLAFAILPVLGWRWLLVISSTPLALFVVIFYFYGKESPRYLLSVGRVQEAEALLDHMLLTNGRPDLMGVTLIPFAAPQAPAPRPEQGQAKGDLAALITHGATPHEEPQAPAADTSTERTALHSTALTSEPADTSPRHDGTPRGCCAALSDVFAQVGNCTKGFFGGLHALFATSDMARLTAALWVLWLCNAICYYGIVLLGSALSLSDHEEGLCHGSHSSLQTGDFIDLLIQSASELPGTFIAAWAIDFSGLGRKWLQAVMFAAAGVAFFLIIPFQTGFLRTAILFIGRGAALGVFLVTYTYTPEVYPTHLRTTGFGLANSFARIGGMVAPFIGQTLVTSGHIEAAAAIFGGFCLLAVAAAASLKHETANKTLEEAAGQTAAASNNGPAHPHSPLDEHEQPHGSLAAHDGVAPAAVAQLLEGVHEPAQPAGGDVEAPSPPRASSVSDLAVEVEDRSGEEETEGGTASEDGHSSASGSDTAGSQHSGDLSEQLLSP